MSEKESLKQKMGRGFLSFIQFICVLVVLFSSLGLGLFSYYFLINLFVGGFNAVVLIEFASGLLGLLLLFEFLATKIEEKVDLKSKEEAFAFRFKKNLRFFGYVYLFFFGFFIAGYILEQYLSLFPQMVAPSLKLQILSTLIQADGFLIALSGVVFAQMLWSINNQQNSIQLEVFQKPKNPNIDLLKKHIVTLDGKRRDMTLRLFSVLSLFIVSISFSLSEMAVTESSDKVSLNITNPFLTMLLGIFAFMFFIATIKMSVESV